MANTKQYTVTTTSDVATSVTAKTVVSIVNGSTTDLTLIGIKFSSDCTATAGAYLVELVSYDQTSAGTSTAETLNKIGGTTNTSRASSVQRNYTAEPTNAVTLDAFYVPAICLAEDLLPLGREFAIPVSHTFGLRVKAPAGTPNVRATLTWEE